MYTTLLEEWKAKELARLPQNKKNAITRLEQKLEAIKKDLKPVTYVRK